MQEPLAQHATWGGAGVVGVVVFILTFSSNPKLHMGLAGALASTVMFGAPLMQIVRFLHSRMHTWIGEGLARTLRV